MIGHGGTNLDYARAFNRRVIIEAVRLQGPITRAELTRLTHLSAQTISNIVAELVESGLILVEGRRTPRRGQPGTDLALNPNGAATIGLAIEQNALTAVLLNLTGEIKARRSIPLAQATPELVFPAAETLVDEMKNLSAGTPLWGLGISMPGPFEVDAADFTGPATLPGWEGIAARERFEETLGLSVEVERDAAAAARAEYLYGAAKPMRHFFYLHFGVGLGGAFVIDGHPLRGARGNAGEIGLMPASDGQPLESKVSLLALHELLRWKSLTRDIAEQPDHPAMVGWIAIAAKELRRGVRIIENLFDPQSIVIGGHLPPPILEALITALQPLDATVADRHTRRFARLTPAALGPDAQAMGAAALPMHETLSPHPKSLRKIGADTPAPQV
ncbi:ROK family protein [Lacibacterium aquatile]|uniref:ROK family protein n=1 Tax=Lacibacterium aquatile TaxID=1168082 RepID=A0ABW5DQC5_9PROT